MGHPSEREIVVLSREIRHTLAFEHGQGAAQCAAQVCGRNDLIKDAELCGRKCGSLVLGVRLGKLLGLGIKIVAALENSIRHGDMDRMAAIRRNKRTL